MKLGYFADGPWSHKAFEMIINDKRFEVLFIVSRFSKPDLVLKKFAENNNIDFLVFENINSDATVSLLKDYHADLFVSMSYDQIIKEDLLKLPLKGFINCHAGALPFYRGRNVLNWVLINGESEFGITVHYIDEGIDTGAILLKKELNISLKSYAHFRASIYPETSKFVRDVILDIIRGDDLILKSVSQDERQAKYRNYIGEEKIRELKKMLSNT